MSKYWEDETPEVITTDKNEIRVFNEAGKIQVFPKIGTGRGIGKGATIDLEAMGDKELTSFVRKIEEAVAMRVTRMCGEKENEG